MNKHGPEVNFGTRHVRPMKIYMTLTSGEHKRYDFKKSLSGFVSIERKPIGANVFRLKHSSKHLLFSAEESQTEFGFARCTHFHCSPFSSTLVFVFFHTQTHTHTPTNTSSGRWETSLSAPPPTLELCHQQCQKLLLSLRVTHHFSLSKTVQTHRWPFKQLKHLITLPPKPSSC